MDEDTGASPGQARAAVAGVLRLGRELAAAEAEGASPLDRRQVALAALRALARDVEDLSVLPGEADLRAAAAGGGSALAQACGGPERVAAVLEQVDRARAAWRDGWGSEGHGAGREPDAATARLRVLRSLLIIIRDGATVDELTARSDGPTDGDNAASEAEGGGIRAWAGWELSNRALDALCGTSGEAVRSAVKAALGADHGAAARSAAALAADHPVVGLIAELERRARERGPLWVPVLVEVAAPPATGAWMLPLRAELAVFCRHAEEHADALAAGDADRGRRTRRLVDDHARRLLARLRDPE